MLNAENTDTFVDKHNFLTILLMIIMLDTITSSFYSIQKCRNLNFSSLKSKSTKHYFTFFNKFNFNP